MAYHFEPENVQCFNEDPKSRQHFQQVGVYIFCERLQGFHEEWSQDFSLTFNGSHANIRGFGLPVSEKWIVATIGLLGNGERWFKTYCLKDSYIWNLFLGSIHPFLDWTEGMQRKWLAAKWTNIVYWLHKYVTCLVFSSCITFGCCFMYHRGNQWICAIFFSIVFKRWSLLSIINQVVKGGVCIITLLSSC